MVPKHKVGGGNVQIYSNKYSDCKHNFKAYFNDIIAKFSALLCNSKIGSSKDEACSSEIAE